MRKENGDITEDKEEILTMFQAYYEDLFKRGKQRLSTERIMKVEKKLENIVNIGAKQ